MNYIYLNQKNYSVRIGVYCIPVAVLNQADSLPGTGKYNGTESTSPMLTGPKQYTDRLTSRTLDE